MQGSKNRRIGLAAALFSGVGSGIAVVLSSNLLILLTNSTLYVGIAEGLPAIVPLLLAFPAGVWFDKTRSNTPRLLGLSLSLLFIGLQAVCVCSFGLLYGHVGFWVLFALFVGQNAGVGLARGSVEGKEEREDFRVLTFGKQSGKIQ